MSTIQTNCDSIYPESPVSDIDQFSIRNLGIEFEFPLADYSSDVPATPARNSTSFRRSVGNGTQMDLSPWVDDDLPTYMGRDHTGVEIRSPILDLNSDQAGQWYRSIINYADDLGYTHAACGYGDTVFGLHFHLSPLTGDQVVEIQSVMGEPWVRAFFCASVSETSADPWRHGGVSNGAFTSNGTGMFRSKSPSGRHEFRLPEPGLPEHLDVMVRFFQLYETNGIEDARDFARELVYTRDERLTSVRQAAALMERDSQWPHEECFERETDVRTVTTPSAAEDFNEIVVEPLREDMGL